MGRRAERFRGSKHEVLKKLQSFCTIKADRYLQRTLRVGTLLSESREKAGDGRPKSSHVGGKGGREGERNGKPSTSSLLLSSFHLPASPAHPIPPLPLRHQSTSMSYQPSSPLEIPELVSRSGEEKEGERLRNLTSSPPSLPSLLLSPLLLLSFLAGQRLRTGQWALLTSRLLPLSPSTDLLFFPPLLLRWRTTLGPSLFALESVSSGVFLRCSQSSPLFRAI